MKLLAITVVLLSLLGGKCFGVVLSGVEAPQDDLRVLWPCDTNGCRHPELLLLDEKHNDLLQVHFFPLKQTNIQSIFGAKLAKKPDDFVKPLFVPSMIMESGLRYNDAANKRHIDYHTIGDLGYLEVHYAFDGESIATCVIYLRPDAGFVPLKSTNDIPPREAWDNAKFGQLQNWLKAHMPTVTDLGEVEVSTSQPALLGLGMGAMCRITTRDIHNDTVPFWLSINLEKETVDLDEKHKSAQYKSVTRTNEPLGFAMDGKFYQLTPKFIDRSRTANK